MWRRLRLIWTATAILFCGAATAETPYRIYIDAEQRFGRAAAEAIRMGITTALALDDNRIAGRAVEVVPLDHRGNAKRSLLHLRRYRDDPNAIAMFSGMHSPPYLRNRAFINEHGLLLLVPWAAAGPVTRPPGTENFIFRVSIDDTKAGPFLARDAVQARGCSRTAVLIVDTGWGRYNLGRIQSALQELGQPAPAIFTFQRGISDVEGRVMARDIAASGADCVVMVSAIAESVSFVNLLAEFAPHIRISSHWAVVSSVFIDQVPHAARQAVELQFLHTCFPFDAPPETEFIATVERTARHLFGDAFRSFDTLPAAVGFVHAFDATRMLLAAAAQIETAGSIAHIRNRLRFALENLDTPVQGLMRIYRRPFRPYGPADPDAHEALGAADLCMVKFGPEDQILSVRGRGSRVGR
ncbi:MAG: ABC transporter substrate-binding protein [Pseudomonadota bacterium]